LQKGIRIAKTRITKITNPYWNGTFSYAGDQAGKTTEERDERLEEIDKHVGPVDESKARKSICEIWSTAL
jgi:hypothetical protein